MLSPPMLAMIGRALLFRGEFAAAMMADGTLVPCQSWDVLGTSPDPMEWGYRLHYAVPRGTETMIAPAEAVQHLVIGASPGAPWRGRSPLRGAMADGELALAAANAIRDEGRLKPFAWLAKDEDSGPGFDPEQAIEVAQGIRKVSANRLNVVPSPLKTGRVRPELDNGLNDARRTAATQIAAAAGIPANLLDGSGDGAASRESYRRLIRATIEPLGRILAHEASLKTGNPVTVDFAALRASDTAMQARAFAALVANGVDRESALELSGLETAE